MGTNSPYRTSPFRTASSMIDSLDTCCWWRCPVHATNKENKTHNSCLFFIWFLYLLIWHKVNKLFIKTRRNNLRFTLNLHFRFVIDISFSRVDFHFFPFHRSSDTLPFTKCKHYKTARTDIPIEQEIHHNKFHFPQNRFIWWKSLSLFYE